MLNSFARALTLDWLFLIAIAPFIGSFLSVWATRIRDKRSIIFGRSVCPACQHKLATRDLMPILSWVFQRRRCRYCGTTIPALYPLMELGSLLVAVCAAWQFSGWLLWIACVFGWIMLLIAAIDYLWMVVPDELTLPLIPAGVAVPYLFGNEAVMGHVLGAAVGFVAFAALASLYRWLRGRDGLGMGDAKLLGASGAWVSIVGLPSVVLLASVSALVGVFMASLAGRKLSSDDKVAFGTYLCLGTWLVWLLGPIA